MGRNTKPTFEHPKNSTSNTVKIFNQTLRTTSSSSHIKRYVYGAVIATLGLMISGNAIALSATTTAVIQGSAPYFTFDGGRTKVTNSQGLLGITLSDGRQYVAPGSPSGLYPNGIENSSSVEKPIVLSGGTTTFSSIKTLVPLVSDGNYSYPRIALNNLASSYGYWADDDGDKNVSATGDLTVVWQDKNGIDITSQIRNNQIQTLDPCDAPYKLEVKATGGQLSTLYGIPKITSFSEEATSYYISPRIDRPYVCYAQPNLYRREGGPNWVDKKGFKVASIHNFADNFPSTGSNGLHFYLLLAGITPEQVIAANGATVFAESGESTVNLSLTAERTSGWELQGAVREVALKILLNGPNKDSNNTKFTPSEFKLYADSGHNQLLYSFKIERWYIIKPGIAGGYNSAEVFCNSLGNGYRITGIEDYTNGNLSSYWTGGIPGLGNTYRRQMSYKNGNKWVGGLFNEWGNVGHPKTYYPSAIGWEKYSGNQYGYDVFWTSEKTSPTYYNYYDVNSDGYIGSNFPSTATHRVVCVAP
ncbi:hypothetical protein [Gilliamella sp. ESL0250]|uniref:hypothetical protein n=1 Tax=Gilliamella sp. ESL0250 TaxID=2705036 RepID=UPI001580A72E|nr:hypothetical protein [Gilliamella sp. ESL0250]NUF48326.1 hypothetical protein [Gilliamella sp. ESL0250]